MRPCARYPPLTRRAVERLVKYKNSTNHRKNPQSLMDSGEDLPSFDCSGFPETSSDSDVDFLEPRTDYREVRLSKKRAGKRSRQRACDEIQQDVQAKEEERVWTEDYEDNQGPSTSRMAALCRENRMIAGLEKSAINILVNMQYEVAGSSSSTSVLESHQQHNINRVEAEAGNGAEMAAQVEAIDEKKPVIWNPAFDTREWIPRDRTLSKPLDYRTGSRKRKPVKVRRKIPTYAVQDD